LKSPVHVELVNVFIGLEDSLGCPVGEMIDCRKAYLSAQGEKEWNLIYKKDIRGHRHFAVEFEKVLGYLHKVLGHMSWFGTCGLSFQGCDVLSPDLVGCYDIVDSHWAVPDLVALDDPFEVFHRWVSKV
jgi:hypothetical protein